jgi:hypothetical protein
MTAPIICFGQQPCGFFPKRFLFAKIQTARRLQGELGGEIVFFCHDSDHDPRETKTILRHRKTNEPAQLNFAFENRLQRKFSPQYLKRIHTGWQDKTLLQLPNYVERRVIEVFKNTSGWCVPATQPSVARPATSRNFMWTFRLRVKSSAPVPRAAH